MDCLACGHDNRALAKFCEECGAPFAQPDAGSVTPARLADKIRHQRPAEGERRRVTVLFADALVRACRTDRHGPPRQLVGSRQLTALAAAVDLGNPPQLWKTHAAIGCLRRAQGRAEDARRAFGEALSVIETVAAGLTDGKLRETLRNSDRVQEIRRAAAARV